LVVPCGPLRGLGQTDISVVSTFDSMSYPIFMPKSSTHCMHVQDQLFHTYGQKVLTDNQMS
jgi:hypothetical protein